MHEVKGLKRDIKVEVKVEVENKKNRRISKPPLGGLGVENKRSNCK
jgi:hypothetical protein